MGEADEKIRASVGILTESPGLYERLSARHNLEIFAELYGCKDVRGQVDKYLRLLGLWDRRETEAGTFSKGMKQKLAIARALLHEPRSSSWTSRPLRSTPRPKTVREFVETLLAGAYHLPLHPQPRRGGAAVRPDRRVQAAPDRDRHAALRAQLFGRQTVVHLTPGSDLPALAPGRAGPAGGQGCAAIAAGGGPGPSW